MYPIQCIEVIRIEDELTKAELELESPVNSIEQEKNNYTLRLKEIEELKKQIEFEVAH